MTDHKHEYGRKFDADVYDKEYFEGKGDKSGYQSYGDARGIVREQFEMIRKVMENRVPRNTVLDVGCAYGFGAAYLEETGWQECSGFDVSDWAIEEAKRRHPTLDFKVGDATDLSSYHFKDRYFGLVTATELFEHVETDDVWKVIENMSRAGSWGFVVVNASTYPDAPHDTDGDHGHLNHHSMTWWIEQFARFGQIDYEAMLEFNIMALSQRPDVHWHNRCIAIKFN